MMDSRASNLFERYQCLDCHVNLYCCTDCDEFFFIRGPHFCYSQERVLLLTELYGMDEGFSEICQTMYGRCSCRTPCRHLRLVMKD